MVGMRAFTVPVVEAAEREPTKFNPLLAEMDRTDRLCLSQVVHFHFANRHVFLQVLAYNFDARRPVTSAERRALVPLHSGKGVTEQRLPALLRSPPA